MHQVIPKVILIAKTEFLASAIPPYLVGIGMEADEAATYMLKNISDAERLSLFGGKICYNAFKAGLNPNVKKVRDDPDEYLTNILSSCHGSVLEHASFTFLFWNVSRVFTHELVRHRAGCAMSQESLRYVMPEDLGFFLPSLLDSLDEEDSRDVIGMIEDAVQGSEMSHGSARMVLDLDKKPFAEKKKWTSALRRILPQGMSTSIMFTMNLRAARHIVQMRTSRHAEEEIRFAFDKVAKILRSECPILFGDFVTNKVDGINEWTSPYPSNPYDYNKEG